MVRNCQITRRGFVTGCSAAIAALAGSRFNSLAFAQGGGVNDEILVVLFLRGGQDGLSLVVPSAGFDRGRYEALRPALRLPASSIAAHPLGSLPGPDGAVQLGLHPAAAPLHELYVDGHLSVVVAAGMAANERSHFDSMNWMELGTPGVNNTTTGWITRHLASAANLPASMLMPSVSIGGLQALSQLGSYETVNLGGIEDFTLSTGPWSAREAQRVALRNLYEGSDSWLHQAGLQALDAVDVVELYAGGGYTPQPGAVYPETWFGDNLKTIAQFVKLGLGLRIATLDLGGWDHHDNQAAAGAPTQGIFADLVDELSRGLRALWEDLGDPAAGNPAQRLTLLVMSEFGRRASENADLGTDHGHGNNLLVLSGHATGGLHGAWPGLRGDLLDEGDLAVTTDFRRVLSEVLVRRLGNPRLDLVFPGYTGYQPLGVVTGVDLPVGEPVFADGFETGDARNWTLSG
ncbi:MAG: DUF1501 domain-containing protein [Thermoanaerobaculia bacterium]|jgi:uncharacterized protein (DUF1501 family)|nr:MAG: DUF1501 domain-containing protein [Thermoanaerobaculia bacterium]MBZ0102813.1 DUF1501 domain-containing protein [Thermoanaerobaculia bacterium]